MGGKSSDNVPFLPEEVIGEILVRLPANVLHGVMRHICKQWYAMISSPILVKSHLLRLRSNPGLLVYRPLKEDEEQRVELLVIHDDDTIENINRPCPGRVWSSCDGLVIFPSRKRDELFLANPATNRVLTLPRLPRRFGARFPHASLGRDPASNKYKVVCYIGHGCAIIITIGVDSSWRVVEHFGGGIRNYHPPVFVGNFFYVFTHSGISVMDAESEAISSLSLDRSRESVFLAMGDALSKVVQIGEWEWQVWKLVENREWVKMDTIDMGGGSARAITVKVREPLGWLKNGQLLIFLNSLSPNGTDIAYHLNTRECYEFRTVKGHYPYHIVQYFSSLVSWD